MRDEVGQKLLKKYNFLPHQKNQYLPILRKKNVSVVNVRKSISARGYQAIKKPDQVGVFFLDSLTWGYSLELMAKVILPDFA